MKSFPYGTRDGQELGMRMLDLNIVCIRISGAAHVREDVVEGEDGEEWGYSLPLADKGPSE